MHGSPFWLLLLLMLVTSCDESSRPVATSTSSGARAASLPTSPVLSGTSKSSRPMMISFSRDFCLPCQVMKPWIAQLRGEHNGKVDVVEVNIDRGKYQRFGQFFLIKSVPTQIFISSSGHLEARHDGVATKNMMNQTFKRLGWVH